MGQRSNNNKPSNTGIEMEREMQNLQGKNPKSSLFKKGEHFKVSIRHLLLHAKGEIFPLDPQGRSEISSWNDKLSLLRFRKYRCFRC